jgi:lipid-binding SYLF domain-containing protein
MKTTKSRAAAVCALLGMLATTAAVAATKAHIDAGVARAIRQFHALNPEHAKLEKKAFGELVFPRLTKGGIGVAGEYGEGALLEKGQTVGYYSLSSASIGLTLGAARHREILLFMTQDALDKFVNSQGWSAGADTGVAVVSQGAGGAYDSETLNKPVLAFIFGVKGLIGDASIEGSKINKIDR